MSDYADEFQVHRYFWPDLSARRCRYSLALGDVAFADFDVDADQRLVLRRISFDGYGCCEPAAVRVSPMPSADSAELIGRMGNDEQLDTAVVRSILRRYFEAHRDVVWEDALVERGLVRGSP